MALLVGAVLFGMIGRRSRDFTTAVLTLMPVAIAINIAVGSITVLLRLPIYLDSIGTVLVGALAGPWAGALTGILANLIWSILPIPGGAGPTIAFYAPVAGVIGLMAGFWASRGVFQLRADDARVGGFLSLAAGIVAAGLAFLVVQIVIGIPDISAADPATALDNQGRFVLIAVACVAIGAVVAWLTARTVFDFRGEDPRIRSYLVGATAIAAFAIVFACSGCSSGRPATSPGSPASTRTARPTPSWAAPPDRRLPCPDPVGLIAALVLAGVVGYLVWTWARRGDNARLFPVWIGGATTGSHRRGDLGADLGRGLRRRDRRRHRRARRALPDARPGSLPVGLRPGADQRPARQDDQLHDRLRDPGRPADHRSDDVQPRRGDGRRVTRTGG